MLFSLLMTDGPIEPEMQVRAPEPFDFLLAEMRFSAAWSVGCQSSARAGVKQIIKNTSSIHRLW